MDNRQGVLIKIKNGGGIYDTLTNLFAVANAIFYFCNRMTQLLF